MNVMDRDYTYGKQSIDSSDIESIIESIKSGWLTQGPNVDEFEKNLKNRFNVQQVVAVANGTAALHLLGLACKWGGGDIVITSPITFLASANCALYSGARPDFCDIDPQSYTICPARLEEKLKKYQKSNKRVKAVVAVDFAGHPCEWDDLRQLADHYNFQLIDDACHALGALYKGKEICSSTWADAVVLSFHPVKTITTGEGGAVLTNQSEIADRVKLLRTHGITKDPHKMEKNDGPWYYEMHELGFNYRITDFQCALGSNQLKKLPYFNQRRKQIATFYDTHLDDELTQKPHVKAHVQHAYHLYPLQLNLAKLRLSRLGVFNRLNELGLHLQVHYYPVHLQPFYQKNFGYKRGDFINAENFYDAELSLPMYPELNDDDLQYITKTINLVLREGAIK